MTISTGARPLSDAERNAVVLYFERMSLEEIAARTELSPARIAAAVDQTRIQAQAAWQPAAKVPAAVPAEPSMRVRRVMAAPQRPAVACAPPTRWPDAYHASGGELADRTKALPPAPEVPAAAPSRPAPAVLEPGSRAWNRLATSGHVRDWAATQGWQLPPPGTRLPGAIILAFHQAHGDTP